MNINETITIEGKNLIKKLELGDETFIRIFGNESDKTETYAVIVDNEDVKVGFCSAHIYLEWGMPNSSITSLPLLGVKYEDLSREQLLDIVNQIGIGIDGDEYKRSGKIRVVHILHEIKE